MTAPLAELDITVALRPGTRAFASTNAEVLASRLEPLMPRLVRQVRSLRGASGLIVRRHFAQAGAAWERFFWAEVGDRHVRQKQPLTDALRQADEALLGLSVFLQPL